MTRSVVEAAGVGHRIEHDDDACGAIEHGSPDTFVGRDRRAAALAHQHEVPCDRCEDEAIAEGSATVFVNHKPLARRDDEIGCGARIREGEATVLVGRRPNERRRARDPLLEALLSALRGR